MLLVAAFAVRANGYCYVSREINRFSKSFRVVNIKKGWLLETRDSVLGFRNSIRSSLEYASSFVSSCNAPYHCVTSQKGDLGFEKRESSFTSEKADLCLCLSQNPLATISSRASGVMLASLLHCMLKTEPNYNYHKNYPRILWGNFFWKLYNFDNFIRRRMSDHNKITFPIKYLLTLHLGWWCHQSRDHCWFRGFLLLWQYFITGLK